MKFESTANISTENLKILIYGHSGAGKTSLAGTIKDSVLIVSAESGLLSLSSHDIPVLDISQEETNELKFQKLTKIYKYLQTEEAQKKFNWIFIDSVTEIANILVQALKSKFTDRKDGLVLWGEYNDRIRNLIKAFRDLKGYHVVMTALQTTNKDEVGKRYNGVDLPGKISSQVEQYFDEVFNLQIHQNEDGDDVRLLLTNRDENTVAKDRSGKLNKYVQANLDYVKTVIKGEK